MKLYEVNQLIAEIFEQLVNPETGEVISDEALLAQLDSLQMERSRILEYLAKLVLNTKASILDRECAGEKTDCGVATVCYRRTTKVDVADSQTAISWLKANGYDSCYKQPDPEVSKTEVKKLLQAGTEIPGITLTQDLSCSLR